LGDVARVWVVAKKELILDTACGGVLGQRGTGGEAILA
jgi:hypothetical protein